MAGGSLTIQIVGSSPSNKEVENSKMDADVKILSAMDKQKLKNGLSVSAVVVRSREDVTDVL